MYFIVESGKKYHLTQNIFTVIIWFLLVLFLLKEGLAGEKWT
jgi:hypothetical protein